VTLAPITIQSNILYSRRIQRWTCVNNLW